MSESFSATVKAFSLVKSDAKKNCFLYSNFERMFVSKRRTFRRIALVVSPYPMASSG
jgi:hypothetical protein